MTTRAEIRIDSHIVEDSSYYMSEKGSPEEMKDFLENIVKEARNMKGKFVKDLEYNVRTSKKLDSSCPRQGADYVYKIDENGEIHYKGLGDENWSTYD